MDNKEILEFLKDYKELFQDKPENLDWAEIYNLASARFKPNNASKFTEFWLNRNTHPEKYLTELPQYFLAWSDVKEFIIPHNITSIGEKAFSNCESLTSVTIPDSITIIGNNAFWHCSSLTSVVIPDSVTSIGLSVFWDCRTLTSIEIPNSVTEVSYQAFCYCTNLKNVTIGNSVTSISEGAFYNCKSLTKVIIPNHVIKIGKQAFEDCGDKLIIDYNGSKEDWKKIYNPKCFQNTYFTVNCTDGTFVKKKR